MGYKAKGFLVSIWQKLKLLIILAILAGIGYGGWIGWKKFIRNAQRSVNSGEHKRAAAVEARTK